MKRSVAVFALVLAACSGSDKYDPTATWSAEKLYTEAKDALGDGKYDQAIKYFESLEARYPYGRYAQQAILEGAYASYRTGETATAIAACDRFIRTYPNHPSVDYAYYLKGLVYFREDQGLIGYVYELDLSEREPKAMRESFAAFNELVTKFPESRYAADSLDRMRYLTNALATYDVKVGEYYYSREAYIAAANRAQSVLVTYPRTQANERALVLLIKSYDKLGLTQLRDDSQKILERTFPQSPYLTGAGEKPWWKLW